MTKIPMMMKYTTFQLPKDLVDALIPPNAEWQAKGDGFRQNLFKPTRILLGFKTPQRENTHKTLTLVSKPSRLIRNVLIRLTKQVSNTFHPPTNVKHSNTLNLPIRPMSPN